MTKRPKKPARIPPPPDTSPLTDVRDWLRKEAKAGWGQQCPCCDQRVQIYHRTLNSATATVMIALWRLDEGIDHLAPAHRQDADPKDPCKRQWTRLPKLLDRMTGTPSQGGYGVQASHWGLMERREGIRADGSNRVGWWRLTDLGEQFVLSKATVPEYTYQYNSRCLGTDGDPINIKDALGKKFDYGKLMGYS